MAAFDPAFEALMSNEGTDITIDLQTREHSRFGITLKTAAGLGLCKPDDTAFIDGLSLDRAKDFYLDRYWRPLNLDKLDQAIATKFLDMVVNMGGQRAVSIVQRACNALGARINEDGFFGMHTLQAIRNLNADQLLLELRAESLQFYRNLVDGDPGKYAKYWDGWKERAEK